MCQIMGYVGRNQTDLTDITRLFSQGYNKTSGSHIHKHGWGIAHFARHQSEIAISPVQADKCEVFAKTLNKGIFAENAFMHLRYATVGDIDVNNNHPFSYRDNTEREWILMHQGTLFNFEPVNKYFHTQNGSTDSERILLYLADCVNRTAPLTAEQRFSVLETEIAKMAKGNKLNLAIYDGEFIFLHSNFADSLYLCDYKNGTLFCTVPLLETKNWRKIPLNTLVAFRDGEVVKSGAAHSNTYVNSPEDERRLYEIYAGL